MILVYSCLAVESTTTSGYRVTPTPFGGCGVPAFPGNVHGLAARLQEAKALPRFSRVSSGRWPEETRMGKRTGTAWTFPGNWSGHSPTHSSGAPSTRGRGPRPTAGARAYQTAHSRHASRTSAALACRVAPPHFSNVRPPEENPLTDPRSPPRRTRQPGTARNQCAGAADPRSTRPGALGRRSPAAGRGRRGAAPQSRR